MPTPVDHLVHGAPTLDGALDDLERRLGVRGAFGGRHDGRGTHNAVIGLGAGAYLELIAPDPEQPAPTQPRPFGLDELDEAGLVG
nr:VOC family protein [Acidimicrobiia bacterium]